ncbi:ribonuclease H-like domain-containing protein [Geopyxis carbonaria]|nr:ribonuclease H-like domain-containing protein [Geopyxis carbonaria]
MQGWMIQRRIFKDTVVKLQKSSRATSDIRGFQRIAFHQHKVAGVQRKLASITLSPVRQFSQGARFGKRNNTLVSIMSYPSDAPLVWIDCEMTGLDTINDVLLQVCCYITDAQLNLLEPNGFETVIHQPQEVLSKMDDWCTKTHRSTGLTKRVLESTVTAADAESALLEYMKSVLPDPAVLSKSLLAGNTVHMDKIFLLKEMPKVVGCLSYRLLDVSAIKEGARRWCSKKILAEVPRKKGLHEARMDILESIEEARYWKTKLFDGK